MSKYTYVLKADRPKYRDGSGWLNLDVSVTVVAEDYEAAKEEALRILPKPPGSYGWSFWTQSIAPHEEPDTRLAEYAHIIAEATAKVFYKEANPFIPAQQAAVAIHSVPPVPRDYSEYDPEGFAEVYMDGPYWDSEREEYRAICDVCDLDADGNEDVVEGWMIDHANAHIGGTI